MTGQQAYFLDVPGTGSAAALSVVSFEATEKMGEPNEVRIVLTHAQQLPRADYLSRDAVFTIRPHSGTVRKFSGYIERFSTVQTTKDFTRYELVLKSHFGRLQAVTNTQTFQHLSTPQIIREILRSHGMRDHQMSFRLRSGYPAHRWRFQYQMTDFSYVHMLMQKAGIYCFMVETEYGDQIVFADDIDHYVYDPQLIAPYRETAGLEAGGVEAVTALKTHTQTVPQSFAVADYNPEAAWERMRDEANVAPRDETTYGQPYIYGTHHLDRAGAKWQAQLRHEAAIARQVVYEGESNVLALQCARVLETDLVLPDAPKGHVITEVTHSGARDRSYTNRYRAIPAGRRFRLQFEPAKWARISGTLSARVCSPDKYTYGFLNVAGYYVVRLDADFGSSPKGGESVPLRLAKPFAGKLQTGMHFVALDGDEAVISFRDGDPDKPEITAFHHHSQARDLVTSDRRWLSRNVIRTQSNNKLRMEDWAGQEGIKLSTEHSGKSQLNLGYLVNSRLEYRGEGFELRTDKGGAVRAGGGLFLSSDIQESASGKQLDMDAALNQLRITAAQADGLAQAAAVAKAEIADLKAENEWLKNSVAGLREAVMLLSSPKGIALATPDRVSIAAGKDVNTATSGGFNVSALKNMVVSAAGAISLFAQRLGIRMIAARGKVLIQAQSDGLDCVAQQNIELCSAGGTLTAHAANGVVLQGGGTAYIKIHGDSVEIGGAGSLILKVPDIDKQGPGSLSLPMPKFGQRNILNNEKFVLCDELTGRPLANRNYRIQLANGKIAEGKTNSNGETSLSTDEVAQGLKLMLSKKRDV
ncbi:type VI secretion system Vgr family protein [Paraburkholderia phenoliruptrix]|uniref:type VI secretion system Vgr family protein n=1 Tax=Paraburkholderia phenoliruptrix TaxID=252970 RepID=UPI001C6EBE1D|nr:type VI secretion system Vgr family protein [Paraburkholderia phenoliruptrix]MBW9107023.1 type VI secretion system tip protein VgrG [Paraburkholderia phenoliruptrix]MBW9129475.1 type VI secretion system tip protein VgrG [Paraburkholderia ginsengiterrae]